MHLIAPPVALAVVRSKVVVPLLLIYGSFVSHCFVFLWSLLCYVVLSILSSFAIIALRKRELVALLKLS